MPYSFFQRFLILCATVTLLTHTANTAAAQIPYNNLIMSPSMAPLRRDQWRFADGRLFAMQGVYDITYLMPFTLSRDISILDQGNLFLPNTQLKLPSVPVEDSLLFSEGYITYKKK
jgi:hypothetical protein